jgi:hypothetical protein
MNNILYLDKEECYLDTLLCLQTNVTTLTDAMMILKHYEDNEEYECCSGIVKAVNEYKESLIIKKYAKYKRADSKPSN